ncbi:MAG: SRPBCC domain-containing protein [Candidatus Methylomirabilales bacterium]
MADMHHEIVIDASPEKVYDAIATQEGLRGWWTGDSVAEPRVGSIAEFGFYNRQFLFRMRVEELMPGKKVVWSCVGDHDEWKDTRLTWDISQRDGGTVLHFTHGNWRSTTRFFASCNSTWGMLMYRLKDYAEDNAPGPYWEK